MTSLTSVLVVFNTLLPFLGQTRYCISRCCCLILWQLLPKEKKRTRKSSCMNARGIPPARRSDYSFCCPTWVPPPGGYVIRYPPGGGTRTPPGGYTIRYPPGGVPGQVAPPGGYPDPGGVPRPPPGGLPGQVPPWGGYPDPPLPHGILGKDAKHYGIWVPPPLWTDRSMDGRTDACQNITFPRTPYANGKRENTFGSCHVQVKPKVQTNAQI